MDQSDLAIKPLVGSEKDGKDGAATEIIPVAADPRSATETIPVAADARSATIVAPLTFIGGPGGSQHQVRGWQSGQVITRIRVFAGHNTIRAYTIWLTDSNGVTYGNPAGSNFAEYTFQNGERITEMTLWGNGVGTRAGWIEFRTTRGLVFSYGMTGWSRQTAFPVDVASGILVGCIFNAGDDIFAHGFYFLNAMNFAELQNVRYPTLGFDSAGIVPKQLDHFHFTNGSFERNWEFTRTITESEEQTWSITTGVTVFASISVNAGIPGVAEVQGNYGWEVGVTTHRETTQTDEHEFHWSVSGVAEPRHTIDVIATTGMGSLNVPYEGTMVVHLRNGAVFSYPMRGTYRGVSFSSARVVDQST